MSDDNADKLTRLEEEGELAADYLEELQDITREAIARVRATGEAVKLDAMNPFERKVCHDVVADEGLTSESEGAEPHRRVVILPVDTDGA